MDASGGEIQETARPPAGRGTRLIRVACVLTLLGLVLSVAHLAWSSPLLFTLFMVVAQPAFGLAMLLYVAAILLDLRRHQVL
jgi:hypothetical protein